MELMWDIYKSADISVEAFACGGACTLLSGLQVVLGFSSLLLSSAAQVKHDNIGPEGWPPLTPSSLLPPCVLDSSRWR